MSIAQISAASASSPIIITGYGDVTGTIAVTAPSDGFPFDVILAMPPPLIAVELEQFTQSNGQLATRAAVTCSLSDYYEPGDLTFTVSALDRTDPTNSLTDDAGSATSVGASGGEDVSRTTVVDTVALTYGHWYYFCAKVADTHDHTSAACQQVGPFFVERPPFTYPGPPGVPTGVAGPAQVTLTITPPTDDGGDPIHDYIVYYTPASGIEVAQHTAGQLQIVILNLINGTPYVFQTSAVNDAGPGDRSTASAAITPKTVPAAPVIQVSSMQPHNQQVTFMFNRTAYNGGDSVAPTYTVAASINGTATGTPVAVVVPSDPAASIQGTINGLQNGTSYLVEAIAHNSVGPSTRTAASAFSPVVPRTVPGAPTAVAASLNANQCAVVTWGAPQDNGGNGVTGYVVYALRDDGSGNYVAYGVGTNQGNVATFTTAPLTIGGHFKIQITAVNSAGEGTLRGTSGIVSPIDFPGPPQIVSVSAAGSGQLIVTFAAPVYTGFSPVSSYNVYSSWLAPGGIITAGPMTSVSATSFTATINGLTNDTLYTVTVKAVNARGEGGGAGASATPEIPAPPSKPSITAGVYDNVSGTVILTFTKLSSDIVQEYTFKAYADSDQSTPVAIQTFSPSNGNVVTYAFSGLNPGSYDFAMLASNDGGNSASSDFFGPISVTPKIPFAPTNVVAAFTGTLTTIRVSYTLLSDPTVSVTGYTITASNNHGAVVASHSEIPSKTFSDFASLPASYTYTFHVVVNSASATSAPAYSNSIRIGGPLPPYPTFPNIYQYHMTAIQLLFYAEPTADSYVVSVYNAASQTPALLGTVKISGLLDIAGMLPSRPSLFSQNQFVAKMTEYIPTGGGAAVTLLTGTSYIFQICSVNLDGTGPTEGGPTWYFSSRTPALKINVPAYTRDPRPVMGAVSPVYGTDRFQIFDSQPTPTSHMVLWRKPYFVQNASSSTVIVNAQGQLTQGSGTMVTTFTTVTPLVVVANEEQSYNGLPVQPTIVSGLPAGAYTVAMRYANGGFSFYSDDATTFLPDSSALSSDYMVANTARSTLPTNSISITSVVSTKNASTSAITFAFHYTAAGGGWGLLYVSGSDDGVDFTNPQIPAPKMGSATTITSNPAGGTISFTNNLFMSGTTYSFRFVRLSSSTITSFFSGGMVFQDLGGYVCNL